ncbi:NAD(P)/FAD-dependent oxidoreductase [Bradyrhizobium sp. CCBAU 51627]|uniref:NAD(P)/FAD-dependent oxidoreductase n=1 Tax=Bradyrhizobium sp. CCBAU 51627 TaxID=1325088 RepID=UPI0023065DCB|nr:NAD(P)/FAD-dependent oxidoreductase [Bradyrhizobium sp. CCBAU 51627]MDA9433844.1 FAD-dependent oxidoreductase [Bradyrhizobium sp. CCBAU 51627]
MPDRVDAIVVGAGVVGIAIAHELAMCGREVILLDGESHFGSWTSSRNSEVVHAGLYYQVGSNKAKLCVKGKHLLYEYCRARNIPHRRSGKLVFATTQTQIAVLEELKGKGEAAGVDDLHLLDPMGVQALEPALTCAAALHSPSTGIVDSHVLMLSMLGEAEERGAVFARNTLVERVGGRGDGWDVWIQGEDDAVVSAPILVNAAGLGAQKLATAIEGVEAKYVPPLRLARGVYFAYDGRVPFSRLIYPVPEAGGLGLHLTLDMAGQARFGPDVEWIDEIDYDVDAGRKPAFLAAARAIWPNIEPGRLHPAYAGIRPKISGRGEPAGDFVISSESEHGRRGLVNLFGIESPGLTASMAIARLVLEKLS